MDIEEEEIEYELVATDEYVAETPEEDRRIWCLKFAAYNTYGHKDILPFAKEVERYLKQAGNLVQVKE